MYTAWAAHAVVLLSNEYGQHSSHSLQSTGCHLTLQ